MKKFKDLVMQKYDICVNRKNHVCMLGVGVCYKAKVKDICRKKQTGLSQK